MYTKTNEFSIVYLHCNIPLAVKLLKLIYEKTTMKADDLIFNNQCEKNVYNEYQLLGEMTNLILSIFINTTINLADQLHNLAILSHFLLFI
jgi:hypothetical protein